MKKTLLILFALTLSLNALSQIPNYVPSNGLDGWWPFNGNANDESGNGNNGTVNGATLTVDRFGNLNNSFHFDGSDYISLNSSFFGGSNSVSDLSYSVWINMNNLPPPSTNYHINCKEGFWRTIGLTINELGMLNFGGSQPSGYFGINSNPITLQPSVWYHVVVTYSAANTKIYLNNSIVSAGTISVSSLNYEFLAQGNSTATNYIGAAHPVSPGITDYFNGKIDDFGTWSRALTACEIQDLYHAQMNSASMNISAGLDQSICSGDSITLNGAGGSNYQWNNNVVDGQAIWPIQSSAYVVTAQDTLGCAGTDTVVVTVLENATSTITETALDSYTLNGQTYTQSGTYTQTLTAANGCDSTITLNLTLNFTGIDDLGTGVKKLVKITDLNGKIIPRRKNTLMLFIYEDGTVERVVEMEE